MSRGPVRKISRPMSWDVSGISSSSSRQFGAVDDDLGYLLVSRPINW
ncbi:hypothetical protein HTIA_0882 [Halorhabdus tiamatea SARL4B]|uniref:Uncharacterized protein n=1 Tax=Halorhabdus tiamatea SARL4B TaxID=1033806 RepID=S6CTK5_9EURY|nr:hypothetical protein HTIA_0882 [Halorhabdus tiamatea SARL4B]